MKTGQNISHHWRLLWTSLALLLVLSVNHQVLPAFAKSAASTEKTSVKAHTTQEGTIVKQKVSFEATTSFVDLVLAEPETLPTFTFSAPATQKLKTEAPLAYWTFFLQQQATQPISPNAP